MKRLWVAVGSSWLLALAAAVHAQQPAADGPRYVNNTSLVRPANYREWIFLGSGLGLTYEAEAARANQAPSFTNVFVNPSSYRAFMDSGKWPDGSVFILEVRRSATGTEPNTTGRFQTDFLALEAEVKDSRFPDGWAFYGFQQGAGSAAPLAAKEAEQCVECHTKHTAVERTFVQFYPTLLEVARKKGTVKPGF
jgi:hypothetical protein